MVVGERGCGSAVVRVSGKSTGSILSGGGGGYCARGVFDWEGIYIMDHELTR